MAIAVKQFDAAFAEQSPIIGRFDGTIADFLSIDESLVARCFDWRTEIITN